MNAAEFAQLLPGSRINHKGEGVGRCPGHADRTASLRFRNGRKGLLVHDFAGCELARILAPLGLRAANLFNDQQSPRVRSRSAPTRSAIIAALERAERTYIDDHNVIGQLLSSELNAIQALVSRELGVSLKPVPPSMAEGMYGGRERDPLWGACLGQTLDELYREILGRPAPPLSEYPEPSLLAEAERRAVRLYRGE